MPANPKPWYKSKTLWLQALTIAAAALTALAGQTLIAEHPILAPLTLAILAAINAALRCITEKPLTL